MARRFWRAGHVKPGEFTWGLETKIVYDPQWRLKLLVSATGALITFIVMIVFVITKFTSGAWVIVMLIPTLVWTFFRIHRHYKETAARLKVQDTPVFEHKPSSSIRPSTKSWRSTSAIPGRSWRSSWWTAS
jgi:hypothetical protein